MAPQTVDVGIWKTTAIALATFLTGILLAGGSYVLRAPTRPEVDLLRERQQLVLQRLERLDERLANHAHNEQELDRRLDALERLVNEILNSGA